MLNFYRSTGFGIDPFCFPAGFGIIPYLCLIFIALQVLGLILEYSIVFDLLV